MPMRQTVVTLVDDDRDVLAALLVKKPTEEILVSLRAALNHGLDDVRKLSRSENVDPEQVSVTRAALTIRLERLRAIPVDLVDGKSLQAAIDRTVGVVALCDQLTSEFSADGPPIQSAGQHGVPAVEPAPAFSS